jgi:hypothetical protein
VLEALTHQGARHLPRRNLLTGLADALADWHKAGNRVLLTSRPYGLSANDRRRLDLAEAPLAELPGPLQATLIRRWYAAVDPARREMKAEGLIRHLDERQDLGHLRANPVLLTALCVKYDQGQRLPQDVYRLYDAVVDLVVHKRYATENECDLARWRLAAVALGMHTGESVREERATPAAEVSFDELDRILADYAQQSATTEGDAADVAARRDNLLSDSGLLLPRGERKARFYHLSFQEFLAATRLRRLARPLARVLTQRAATSEWRLTLTFLFCAVAEDRGPQAALGGLAPLLDHLDRESLASNPAPALVLAQCLEIAHKREWHAKALLDALRRAGDAALTPDVDPAARNALWTTLGATGRDDRPGVGLCPDGLPDIAWVEVPAGSFVYQYGERRELPTFWIACYPVTNAQFQAFIDAGGYREGRWWEGLAEHIKAPDAPRWTAPNRPREKVSWYEAVAFCRWLSDRLGCEVRLPTELEWEKAARGTDGREYPWGEGYRVGYANINETRDKAGPHDLRETTVVGLYPWGDSPWGASDLAGNVWEWCLNEYDSPSHTDIGGEAWRAWRGGSWLDHRGLARCAARGESHPDDRNGGLGFRVLRASPILSTGHCPSDH